MIEPTSGFPVARLSNGVAVSFYYETEADSLWFIYRTSDLDVWKAPLNFQMGDTYNTFRGGVEAYANVCIQQINDMIKRLFPALFQAAPAPTGGFPQELVNSGQLSVALSQVWPRPRSSTTYST